MQRNIAIIGTGYVGLTSGVCLAYLGHKVICVDKNGSKIEKLKNGEIPIYEPGLDGFFKRHQKNISFTANLKEAVKESEVVFIAVGTPSNQGGSVDMSYFEKAVREIAQTMNGYKVIVNKSTVPVGTGDWTKEEIRKYFKGEFAVVSNPEFLREGSALKDFLEADRIVIGLDDEKAKDIMLDIYSSLEAPKFITDIRSAELIKYAANAFLATKISFINEIANICERVKGDVLEVAKGIGMDKRIGDKFLNAGVGFGGSCFPKDIEGLISIANNCQYDFKLLEAVMAVNKSQHLNFAENIKKILAKQESDTVCVWGLAFKPNTDDVRKSPAVAIIKELQKAGYKIRAFDPIATENAKRELNGSEIKFCSTAQEAAEGADVLVLITEWPEFSEIDMVEIKELMRHPIIFDGRNTLSSGEIKKLGFDYYGVGRYTC